MRVERGKVQRGELRAAAEEILHVHHLRGIQVLQTVDGGELIAAREPLAHVGRTGRGKRGVEPDVGDVRGVGLPALI